MKKILFSYFAATITLLTFLVYLIIVDNPGTFTIYYQHPDAIKPMDYPMVKGCENFYFEYLNTKKWVYLYQSQDWNRRTYTYSPRSKWNFVERSILTLPEKDTIIFEKVDSFITRGVYIEKIRIDSVHW